MTDGKPDVLFAASECTPLVKTGGLADVVGALPKALSKLGVKSRIILPFYSTLPQSIRQKAKLVAQYEVGIGHEKKYAGLMKAEFRRRTFYFIDNEEYFKRDKLYGYFEDGERFVFFGLAVLRALEYIGDVDIIHCHDWQTALIPAALRLLYQKNGLYENVKTVYTIHNLRHQGKLFVQDFAYMLGLNGADVWEMNVIHNGQANLMKAALYQADAVTTVSQSYAEEMRYAFYGETLEGCIRDIGDKLTGIVNGIDLSMFNPAKDKDIYAPYEDLAGKRANKRAFFKEYALAKPADFTIGMVSRLDIQKGLDLVLYAIDEIMKLPVNFVLQGSGDAKYENAFRRIEAQYPDRARCFIMYNEKIARKIYAASDVFLMPSRFEPCGLGQMIAMRYGALPIVRETGGLKDTVMPYNEVTGEGTGFSFANYNGDELLTAVRLAQNVYAKRPAEFKKTAARAMAADFGWHRSAKEYKQRYMQLIRGEN